MTKKVLSIAGFDGSGGAGIQADLKTFSAFGCYGMTVLTALPIQNTCGVRNFYEIPLSAIQEQLESIFDDITPDAIKIGMLFKAEIIVLVADFLKKHAVNIPIVLDPVMLAKSGDALLLPQAILALKAELIPQATLITPNLPEAFALMGEQLASEKITSREEMPVIIKKLLALGSQAVFLKGGHLQADVSDDLFLDKAGREFWLESPRIVTSNTHGTGCTLSAAIAACLALGKDLPESCKTAKYYLFEAIKAAKDEKIGKGAGPVKHLGFNLGARTACPQPR